MKTKDLIAALQKEDPEGETEVVVGGTAIHFVSKEPGYYDGHYEVLIEDPKKKPYYSVIGGKATSKGAKVKLHLLSIEDALYNCNSEEELDAFQMDADFSNHLIPARREEREKPYRDMIEETRLFIRMFAVEDEHGRDSEAYEEASKKWQEFSQGSDQIEDMEPWNHPRVLERKLREAEARIKELEVCGVCKEEDMTGEVCASCR